MSTHSRGVKRAIPTSVAKQQLFRDDDIVTRRDMSETERVEFGRER